MDNILLYDNEEVMLATKKVLAAFKVKSINQNIDKYISEALAYAVKVDELLESNNLEKRYLDIISNLTEDFDLIKVDSDIEQLDFRAREVIEDYIKRINTRLSMISDEEILLKDVKSSYDISNINLDEEIKKAKLLEADFV